MAEVGKAPPDQNVKIDSFDEIQQKANTQNSIPRNTNESGSINITESGDSKKTNANSTSEKIDKSPDTNRAEEEKGERSQPKEFFILYHAGLGCSQGVDRSQWVASVSGLDLDHVMYYCNPNDVNTVKDIGNIKFREGKFRQKSGWLAKVYAKVEAFLRDNAFASMLMVGHSYGGGVVSAVAEQLPPELVDRVEVATFGSIYIPKQPKAKMVHYMFLGDVAMKTNGLKEPSTVSNIKDTLNNVLWIDNGSSKGSRKSLFGSEQEWKTHNAYGALIQNVLARHTSDGGVDASGHAQEYEPSTQVVAQRQQNMPQREEILSKAVGHSISQFSHSPIDRDVLLGILQRADISTIPTSMRFALMAMGIDLKRLQKKLTQLTEPVMLEKFIKRLQALQRNGKIDQVQASKFARKYGIRNLKTLLQTVGISFEDIHTTILNIGSIADAVRTIESKNPNVTNNVTKPDDLLVSNAIASNNELSGTSDSDEDTYSDESDTSSLLTDSEVNRPKSKPSAIEKYIKRISRWLKALNANQIACGAFVLSYLFSTYMYRAVVHRLLIEWSFSVNPQYTLEHKLTITFSVYLLFISILSLFSAYLWGRITGSNKEATSVIIRAFATPVFCFSCAFIIVLAAFKTNTYFKERLHSEYQEDLLETQYADGDDAADPSTMDTLSLFFDLTAVLGIGIVASLHYLGK